MNHFRSSLKSVLILLLALSSTKVFAHDKPANARLIAHGRYIVKIGGCNDCHTPGYAQSGGNVPEQKWLVGDALGWHGPWGTTYPANLRRYFQTLTEAEWIKTAHTIKYRPPMPWFALHAMKTSDLRAVYAFIRHLGAAGGDVPAYVPPNQTPKGPFVSWPAPPK